MKILAIHDGHTATACYFENESVVSVISEERLSRVKGDGGFPVKSLDFIVENYNIKELDHVCLVGKCVPLVSTNQYQTGRQKFFPLIIKYFPLDPRKIISYSIPILSINRRRRSSIDDYLISRNIKYSDVRFIEHHDTHRAIAYYWSPFYANSEPVLVFTFDGSGDGLSGTITKIDEFGKWLSLKKFNSFDSLGMMYSRVTQYLAMKPWEHEFKLMGMAPYVSPAYAEEVFDVLKHYLWLDEDGLSFGNRTKLWGNSLLEDFYKQLRRFRFDSVAAGVQLLHERILLRIIENWIEKTGISNIALSGGCFMNIKANQLIRNSKAVNQLFVAPSCGDESCAIGAALNVFHNRFDKDNKNYSDPCGLYFGPSFSDDEIVEILMKHQGKIHWEFLDNIEEVTANLLANDKIIGRFAGRMEWGSRALGNRSIIANPSHQYLLHRLNAAVKMRDFWMPFAPSILWERRNDYCVDVNSYESFYMTMGFDSTNLARKHLIAALHPYDFTMRPQFVKAEHNASYHKLIKIFENISGIGGVLNTSFNLHGWPIVCSPKEAVETFLKSGLDFITINNYLVSRL